MRSFRVGRGSANCSCHGFALYRVHNCAVLAKAAEANLEAKNPVRYFYWGWPSRTCLLVRIAHRWVCFPELTRMEASVTAPSIVVDRTFDVYSTNKRFHRSAVLRLTATAAARCRPLFDRTASRSVHIERCCSQGLWGIAHDAVSIPSSMLSGVLAAG